MSTAIIEKLDSIEAANTAKIAEIQEANTANLEVIKTEMTEKLAALEAKVSSIQMPEFIRPIAKSVRQDVNRNVKEQIKSFYKGTSKNQTTLKMFADESEHSAYMKEAAGLTGSGNNQGGRTGYDPVFTSLRLANPLKGIARTVTTDGSSYMFRSKVGNSGPAWGYTIQNNGSTTTENTNIWQVVLQDLNVQFPIRTAALDDIDGLEGNIVSDMLVEFQQQIALSSILNNDQSDSPATYGGTQGLRGLNQYAGSNSSYTGGTTSVAAYGTSGTGATSGLHSLATYDQLTTNANSVTANNVKFADVVNFIYALPQQYWTPDAKIMVNPAMLSAIRGLVDTNGTPVFERMGPLEVDGIVGRLLGFDVVVNKYLNTPNQTTSGSAGTTNLFPMYFGDWQQFYCYVDRLDMVLRRYDQTTPGSIVFYGETRCATSVRDPLAGVRYRSTATAT
jgi:HK97 family phage major capsid protein